jgi:hypothetical protein
MQFVVSNGRLHSDGALFCKSFHHSSAAGRFQIVVYLRIIFNQCWPLSDRSLCAEHFVLRCWPLSDRSLCAEHFVLRCWPLSDRSLFAENFVFRCWPLSDRGLCAESFFNSLLTAFTL